MTRVPLAGFTATLMLTMTMPSVDAPTIYRMILESLAFVKQTDTDTVRGEADSTGNINLTGKEESTVIALLERDLGCGPLLEPKDLGKKGKQANSCLCPIEGITAERLREMVCAKLGIG